jgi:hypothetical protein
MAYRILSKKDSSAQFSHCLGELKYSVHDLKPTLKFETVQGVLSLDDLAIIRTDSELEFLFYSARGTSTQNVAVFYEKRRDINTCFRDLIQHFPLEPTDFSWFPSEIVLDIFPLYQLWKQEEKGGERLLVSQSLSPAKLLVEKKRLEQKVRKSRYFMENPGYFHW